MSQKVKIFEVCDELASKDETPTLEKVRAVLGGGSFSTINPILKEWKNKQSQEVKAVLAMPEAAKETGLKAAALIWEIASETAINEIKAIKGETELQISSMNTERSEATLEVEHLELELSKAVSALEQVTKENNSYNLQTQKQQLSLDMSTKQNDELKAELTQLRQELKTSEAEVNTLKGAMRAYEKINKDKIDKH